MLIALRRTPVTTRDMSRNDSDKLSGLQASALTVTRVGPPSRWPSAPPDIFVRYQQKILLRSLPTGWASHGWAIRQLPCDNSLI